MATSAPPQTPRSRPTSVPGEFSKRYLILSAAALALVLIIGVVVVAVTSDTGPRHDTQGQLTEQGGDKPHIIPRPGDGHAPETPGERGGWEQLTLFGLMLAAMLGIGVVVFRGGKKSQAGRAQWMAAGATGRDGVLEERPGQVFATAPTEPGDPGDQPGDQPAG